MAPSSAYTEHTRLAHIRALDGLRGVAVLAVVLYHFSPEKAPGGFLGVDVFFVLSGFLITSLLVKERERTGGIAYIQFWIRRARRLLPALFLLLAVVGVYALLKSDHAAAHHIGEDGLATFGYFANWHFISSGQSYVERIVQTTPSPLRHAWSLAIEEQFYLVWPLIVGLVVWVVDRTKARLRHTLFAVCVVLGVISFVRMITLYHQTGNADRVYYGTDSRAFLLLIGAALGALTAGNVTINRRHLRIALVVAGCAASVALAVTMATVEAADTWLYDGGYGAIAILMVIVLAAAAQPGLNPVGRVLQVRPLVGLGLISYGVYLWHWPITVWLTTERTDLTGVALFTARALVTLVVSLASYKFIEMPIRRGWLLRWRRGHPALEPIVVGVSVLALVALVAIPVVAYSTVNDIPKVPPSAASAAVSAEYSHAPRCDRIESIDALPAAHDLTVQLFGNSVAVEVKPCLAAIVEARGGTFESVVHSGRAPCHLLPRLRKQVENPETRPDVAIFSAAIFNVESSCPVKLGSWLVQVQKALDIWAAAGTHVYLAPLVPNVPGTETPVPAGDPPSLPPQTTEFEAFAANDPAHVTVLDAGKFVRDGDGVYQWRMFCARGGERGCDSKHTIGVRWVDGLHFCAASVWDGHSCAAINSGGERRVASAMAQQISELSFSLPRAPSTQEPA